jgi:acetoin utilization deacetylase AcuC-like enzyme
MVTGLVTQADPSRHDTGPGHPERADRVTAALERLRASGLSDEVARAIAPECDRAALLRVHDERHVRAVQAAIESGARVLDEGDTRVSSGSWRAALESAGGAVLAVEKVLRGEWANAFVAARPPGHHAGRNQAMGFCVFNNVAVAAAHLSEDLGVERIAIVDWDVHHGNGTQAVFERDPRVFYASLHQWPLYPGTGARSERGVGAGAGTTLNLPQPAHAGDAQWLAAFEGELLPALERFDPRFVLVSAGFDAHRDDPLAQTELTTSAFGTMTRHLLQLAGSCCAGRLVSLLEGGYDLRALSDSVELHVAELVRAPTPV